MRYGIMPVLAQDCENRDKNNWGIFSSMAWIEEARLVLINIRIYGTQGILFFCF